LQEDFEKAAEEAKTLPDGVTNEDKLSLYGLFKQGNSGDVSTSRPGMFDLAVSVLGVAGAKATGLQAAARCSGPALPTTLPTCLPNHNCRARPSGTRGMPTRA
jgi:acyl-CoA-binding protein